MRLAHCFQRFDSVPWVLVEEISKKRAKAPAAVRCLRCDWERLAGIAAVGNTRGHSVTKDGDWLLGALGRSAAANPYKLLNYKQNLYLIMNRFDAALLLS